MARTPWQESQQDKVQASINSQVQGQAQSQQAAAGESRLGAYRETHHSHQQGFQREADDLASQPSAHWKQAADGGGSLGAYRKTQHEHEQSFKREVDALATQPALSESKPLMAEADSPSTRSAGGSNGQPPTSPLNPALTGIAMMGRVMGAYAEFPARLAQCRSPMDIWSAQARFVQRVFSASPVSADRPLLAQSQ
jgi:hypothetical protein